MSGSPLNNWCSVVESEYINEVFILYFHLILLNTSIPLLLRENMAVIYSHLLQATSTTSFSEMLKCLTLNCHLREAEIPQSLSEGRNSVVPVSQMLALSLS